MRTSFNAIKCHYLFSQIFPTNLNWVEQFHSKIHPPLPGKEQLLKFYHLSLSRMEMGQRPGAALYRLAQSFQRYLGNPTILPLTLPLPNLTQ